MIGNINENYSSKLLGLCEISLYLHQLGHHKRMLSRGPPHIWDNLHQEFRERTFLTLLSYHHQLEHWHHHHRCHQHLRHIDLTHLLLRRHLLHSLLEEELHPDVLDGNVFPLCDHFCGCVNQIRRQVYLRLERLEEKMRRKFTHAYQS